MDKIYRVYCYSGVTSTPTLLIFDITASSPREAKHMILDASAGSLLVSGVAESELEEAPPRGVTYLDVSCQQRANRRADDASGEDISAFANRLRAKVGLLPLSAADLSTKGL